MSNSHSDTFVPSPLVRDIIVRRDVRVSQNVTPQPLYISTFLSLVTLVTLFLKRYIGEKKKEGKK